MGSERNLFITTKNFIYDNLFTDIRFEDVGKHVILSCRRVYPTGQRQEKLTASYVSLAFNAQIWLQFAVLQGLKRAKIKVK